MQMYFKNKFGRVNFSASGRGSVRITDISGISNTQLRRESITLADGSSYTAAEYPDVRRITVGGDLLAGRCELSKISRILSRGGTLSIIAKGKLRRIFCDSVIFSVGDRYGAYRKYSAVFVCNAPYFTDFTPNAVYVRRREDLIYPSFTLPCVFTQSVSRVSVINSGDAITPPVFEITALQGGSGSVILKNHTAGKQLSFTHTFSPGETVIANIGNRTLISDVSGSIINSLSADSAMSEFYLVCGANDIEFAAADTDVDFDCRTTFFNLYCEGEY